MKTISLRRRLAFTYAGVALLTAAVLGAVLLTILRLYYDRQELEYMANQARSISASLAESMGSGTMRDLPESVVQNALRADVRVRLLDADGGLLADSGDPQDRPENRAPRAFSLADGGLDGSVREAPGDPGAVDDSSDRLTYYTYYGPVSGTLYGIPVRLAGTGILQRLGLSRLNGQSIDVLSSQTARVAVLSAKASNPVERVEVPAGPSYATDPSRRPLAGIVGWVEVTEGPSYGRQIVTVVAWAWILASGVAVTLAAAIGWLASRHITQPVSSLTSVTSRMARGDLAARATVASGDEIGTLATSFNSMAERVEETVAVLRRFVGDAAHEIHTPLTALRANLALAMDEDDPGHHRLFLERVRDQARRMEELTNDLLDLSRLESGRIEIRRLPLDLAATVREVSEVYASRAEQAGITFYMDLPNRPVTILGDESQVRRALANLLDNAVKFTPTDGTIRVGLASNGALVEVSVADSGIGIPPEDLPNLFSRFHRGRNASAFPGSGLGLAIVKAIMEYHGGQVVARSLDPGTVFTLSWPSSETTAEEVPKQ